MKTLSLLILFALSPLAFAGCPDAKSLQTEFLNLDPTSRNSDYNMSANERFVTCALPLIKHFEHASGDAKSKLAEFQSIIQLAAAGGKWDGESDASKQVALYLTKNSKLINPFKQALAQVPDQCRAKYFETYVKIDFCHNKLGTDPDNETPQQKQKCDQDPETTNYFKNRTFENCESNRTGKSEKKSQINAIASKEKCPDDIRRNPSSLGKFPTSGAGGATSPFSPVNSQPGPYGADGIVQNSAASNPANAASAPLDIRSNAQKAGSRSLRSPASAAPTSTDFEQNYDDSAGSAQ